MTPERAAELANNAAKYTCGSGVDADVITEAILEACAEERANLLKNEFICAKCGLRKDSEHEVTHDF